MIRSIVSLIFSLFVLSIFGYELYRSFFDIDNQRDEYHMRIASLPKGSLGRIIQQWLIDSVFGLWLQRGVMLFGVLISLVVIVMVLRDFG